MMVRALVKTRAEALEVIEALVGDGYGFKYYDTTPDNAADETEIDSLFGSGAYQFCVENGIGTLGCALKELMRHDFDAIYYILPEKKMAVSGFSVEVDKQEVSTILGDISTIWNEPRENGYVVPYDIIKWEED